MNTNLSIVPARPAQRNDRAHTDAAPGHFGALAKQVREAGLLERRPGYYTVKITLTIALFIAGWAALLVIGDSWAALGVAAFLGVMFSQLAFIAHDAGHQQVFRSRRANWRLGLAIGDALIGLTFGWWVAKHNAHHAHPNQVGRDPDIAEGLVRRSPADIGGFAKWLERWRAGLFLPLMVLRSTGLHISGVQWLFRQRDRAAAVELSLIALHTALYFVAVLWLLSPLKVLAFVFVQQAVFSLYLGCSFAPNHKGRPIIAGESELNFATRQVITARNVAGGRLTNLLLGGLNYQIEHHLFPTMPRPNLARARDMIRAFCLEGDLEYSEDNLIGSFRQIINHLRVATPTASLGPRDH